MLKGILFLIAFGLLPWWLSLLADRMDLPLSPSAVLSSWLRDTGTETKREQPPPGWREAVYFARNPDVMASVRRGEFLSGYEHYIRYGRADGRPDGFQAADIPQPAAQPSAPDPAPQEPAASPESEPASPLPVQKPAAVAAVPDAPVIPPPPPPAPMVEEVPVVLPGRKPVPTASPIGFPAAKPVTGQVLAIRSAAHAGFTRIVLDSPTALRAERAPPRGARSVGVDLSAVWQPPRRGELFGKSLSYRVETMGRVETAGGVIRLLFESGEPIHIKALTSLPPDKPGGRHRLILDVAPGG